MRTMPLPEYETDNVITLSVIDGKLSKKEKIRYNKDGSINKWHSNKVAGKSSEVYPLTSKEEINAMLDVFNKHIQEAPDNNKRQIACRNKMLFLIGINVGLRASDLVSLKWNFFFDNNGVFKDFYSLKPKKTRKTGKYVKIYFNKSVKKAITDYIEEYPIEDMNNYLFKSRKGNGAITENGLWKLIVKTASEAGIDKNVGSHTLRKTFGYFAWHNAENKDKALVVLQKIFNHSSTQTTMKYIGLLDSEMEDMFNNIDLGFDYL